MIFEEAQLFGFYLQYPCTLNGTISSLANFSQFLGLTWPIPTSLNSYNGGMEWRMTSMQAKVLYLGRIVQNGASKKL
jgi:hypothetical protein